jgi:hypothetical protein
VDLFLSFLWYAVYNMLLKKKEKAHDAVYNKVDICAHCEICLKFHILGHQMLKNVCKFQCYPIWLFYCKFQCYPPHLIILLTSSVITTTMLFSKHILSPSLIISKSPLYWISDVYITYKCLCKFHTIDK